MRVMRSCRFTSYPVACAFPRWGAVFVLVVMTCLGGLPGQAMAQGISQAQLADLNADDYATRVEATRKLLQDTRLSAADVIKAFGRSRTLEQRHRLMSVAWHHLLREQLETSSVEGTTGAIGINLAAVSTQQLAGIPDAAIVVTDTSPGFPGYAYLEPHDLILRVNGQPLPQLPDQNDVHIHFVNMIERMPPGTRIELTVRRRGKIVNESFRLADKQRLIETSRRFNRSVDQMQLWLRLQRQADGNIPDKQPLNFRLPEARKPGDGFDSDLSGLTGAQRRVRLAELISQLQRDHLAGRITAQEHAERLAKLQQTLDRDEFLRHSGVQVIRNGEMIDLPPEVFEELEQQPGK